MSNRRETTKNYPRVTSLWLCHHRIIEDGKGRLSPRLRDFCWFHAASSSNSLFPVLLVFSVSHIISLRVEFFGHLFTDLFFLHSFTPIDFSLSRLMKYLVLWWWMMKRTIATELWEKWHSFSPSSFFLSLLHRWLFLPSHFYLLLHRRHPFRFSPFSMDQEAIRKTRRKRKRRVV